MITFQPSFFILWMLIGHTVSFVLAQPAFFSLLLLLLQHLLIITTSDMLHFDVLFKCRSSCCTFFLINKVHLFQCLALPCLLF